MTTNNFQQSAKIYQFPIRTSPTAVGPREQAMPTMNVGSPRLAKAAFGSGWYHDAAIQEAERPVRNSIADIVPSR
jgi:hypothetical protein